MKRLGTTGAEGFSCTWWLRDDGGVFAVADFDVDCDGGSNPFHDPYWQPNTSLHHNGKPIDSETVSGIVVPGWLVRKVGPVVLGCKARCTYLPNMKSYDAVVFDTGPLTKSGEGSPYLAKKLGINPDPNNGGEDEAVVLYELWPGVPAIVDGITYSLQHS